MSLDNETQDKIDKLPLSLRMAVNMLIMCIEDIIEFKCDEKEVTEAVNAIKDNSEGRYCKSDLMNYDEAGIALGFGTTNRVGLKRFLDKHGVKQVRFGSTKVGFPRSQIISLKNKNKK